MPTVSLVSYFFIFQVDVQYERMMKRFINDNNKIIIIFQVDVQYQRMMKRFISLSELKKYHQQHKAKGGPLKDMALFTRARLSVQPLTTGNIIIIFNMMIIMLVRTSHIHFYTNLSPHVI